MSQRWALILASALTAFVIVLMLGVMLTVGVKAFVLANTAPLPVAAPSAGTQPSTPVANAPALPQPTAPNPATPRFSAEQAAQTALQLAPKAKLVRAPELVDFQGALAYEVSLDQGTLYIDANNGRILANPLQPIANSRNVRPKENHTEHEGDDDD